MQGIRWLLIGMLLALLASMPVVVHAQRDGFGASPQSFAPCT